MREKKNCKRSTEKRDLIYRVYVCETYVIDGINKYSQDQSTVGYQGVVISQGGPMMWSVNCTVAAA